LASIALILKCRPTCSTSTKFCCVRYFSTFSYGNGNIATV
jgi:hypothetical protein